VNVIALDNTIVNQVEFILKGKR